jgi:RpiR family carbohydrate utilization transcriptional regulator
VRAPAGIQGVRELKIALAQELGSPPVRPGEERGAAGPAAETLAQVTDALADAVRGAAATVDPIRFAAVAEALSTARRVLFAGHGMSAPLVQDAALRFLAIGVQASQMNGR